jgi:hypothetical protein
MIEKSNDNTLENFSGWDNGPSDIDFFSTDEVQLDVETKKEEKKEEAEKKDKIDNKSTDDTSAKEDNDDKDEISFFSADSEEVEEGSLFSTKEENKDEDIEIKKISTTPAVSTLNYMSESGLFELSEDTEITEENAPDILKEALESKAEKMVEEMMGNLPGEDKDTIKYILNGGKISTLINSLKEQSSGELSEDMDLSKVENQKSVARKMLEQEYEDSDFIDIQLEALEESGKLEKFANNRFEKWKTNKEKTRKELVKQQKIQKQEQSRREKEYKQSFINLVKDKEELNGISLSEKDKAELPSYISDRNIKLESGQTISKMQQDLYTALQDNEKALILAKLLKEDFNLESIENKAVSKVSKKVREGLRRNSNKTQSKNSKKSLIDYFS